MVFSVVRIVRKLLPEAKSERITVISALPIKTNPGQPAPSTQSSMRSWRCRPVYRPAAGTSGRFLFRNCGPYQFGPNQKSQSFRLDDLISTKDRELAKIIRYKQSLYQNWKGGEFVYRSISNLSGRSQEPITGGAVSRGNNYRTGTAHLELTASERPTQTLYLRGFGGGEYIGGDWIRSSDEALFDQMQKALGWDRWGHMIPGMYYSMYFVLNENMQIEDAPDPIFLNIRHSSANYENSYVPYYSQRNGDQSWITQADQDRGVGGYTYEYYEQPDMHVNWENVRQDFSLQAGWYHQLQEAYIQQAQAAYTQVPEEILPRLTALVEETPLDKLDDITAFILYTLHSNAVYTLTPGWAPLNEDVVEYFLFERKSGYCVHFAAAATLMYRLYGIPARYAAGYVVDPGEFSLRQDGNYHATVTDKSAHAWVEIFLPEYGWTPVEVTPAADGSIAASYPGFDGALLDQLFEEHNWDLAVPSLAANSEKPGQTEIGSGPENPPFPKFLRNFDWKQYQNILLVAGSCLVYTLLLSPLFLDYRRLRIQRKMEEMNCRNIFDRLLEMLHWCGVMVDMDGTEKDFSDRFREIVPEDAKEKAAAFLKAVCDTAYGPDKPSREDADTALQVYRCIAQMMYDRQSPGKKFIFRYFKAF